MLFSVSSSWEYRIPAQSSSQMSWRNSSREYCFTASFIASRKLSSVPGVRAAPTIVNRSGSRCRKASE